MVGSISLNKKDGSYCLSIIEPIGKQLGAVMSVIAIRDLISNEHKSLLILLEYGTEVWVTPMMQPTSTLYLNKITEILLKRR